MDLLPWFLVSAGVPVFVHFIYFACAFQHFCTCNALVRRLRSVMQVDLPRVYGNVFMREAPRLGPETCKMALALTIGAAALAERGEAFQGSLMSKYGLVVPVVAGVMWVIFLSFSVGFCAGCEVDDPPGTDRDDGDSPTTLLVWWWVWWSIRCILSIAFGIIPFIATCWMLKGGASG